MTEHAKLADRLERLIDAHRKFWPGGDNTAVDLADRVADDASPLLTSLRAHDALVAALEEVLAHVEDPHVHRVANQCTLCFTYRAKLRAALSLARPVKDDGRRAEAAGGTV